MLNFGPVTAPQIAAAVTGMTAVAAGESAALAGAGGVAVSGAGLAEAVAATAGVISAAGAAPFLIGGGAILAIGYAAYHLDDIRETLDYVTENVPWPRSLAQLCRAAEVGKVATKEREERGRKKEKIYFITISKKIPKLPLPADLVGKQFHTKVKSDKYSSTVIPIEFEDSKSSLDIMRRPYELAGDIAGHAEEAVAVERVVAKNRHDAEIAQHLAAGCTYRIVPVLDRSANPPRQIPVKALVDQQGRLITSDIDILAVFDPADDLSFAVETVGHGTSTSRVRALLKQLQPWAIEQGVEAINPYAEFPMRDGIAMCGGKMLCPRGHRNCLNARCQTPITVEVLGGKGEVGWHLYEVEVTSLAGIIAAIGPPVFVKTMVTERDVVDVFNNRRFNPTMVGPSPAWKWNGKPGNWRPSQLHAMPDPLDPLRLKKRNPTPSPVYDGMTN